MSDYIKRQDAANREYADAYAKWLEGMTSEERHALPPGLDRPLHPNTISSAMPLNVSAGAVSAADIDGDDEEVVTHDPSELVQIESASSDAHEYERLSYAIRTMMGLMLSASNMRLTAECIALITGVVYDGLSEVEIARRHGLSRAAVSKRCVEYCEALGLDPSRAMRSEKVRERCRAAQMSIFIP